MTKPKTGKAIMTDGDIMRAVADAEWHDTVGAVKIAIKLARQQGIAEGRAEHLSPLEKSGIAFQKGERSVKEAYEKGLADGKKLLLPDENKIFKNGYGIGYSDGKADFKERLMSGKVVMNMNKWRHTKDGSPHYGLIIEQAIKEAERK